MHLPRRLDCTPGGGSGCTPGGGGDVAHLGREKLEATDKDSKRY